MLVSGARSTIVRVLPQPPLLSSSSPVRITLGVTVLRDEGDDEGEEKNQKNNAATQQASETRVDTKCELQKGEVPSTVAVLLHSRVLRRTGKER